MSPAVVVLFTSVLSSALATTPNAEDSWINRDTAPVQLRFRADVGFVAPLSHTIQFGKDGTLFDYVEDGGQNLLFPLTRWQADLDGGRHTVSLLFQPLQLNSTIVLDAPLRVDGVTMPAGTVVDTEYGFSFWRGTWRYDVLSADDRELAFGAGLQIRNASINFTAVDGSARTTNRDIGPVPLFAGRYQQNLGPEWMFRAEAEGAYAPIKYLNGANTDVVGALLDAGVGVGKTMQHGTDVFLTARYVGGGAEGTDKSPDGLGDGFTNNWLHFAVLSLGATLR